MAIQATKIQSESLHELNVGKHLHFFDKQKTMKIGFVVNKFPKDVKIFKAIEMNLNTNYNAKIISISTSEGEHKHILNNHFRYKIREGKHSVPLKNQNDKTDLRGTWSYIEIEIESINDKKVDLFAITVYLRKSFL